MTPRTAERGMENDTAYIGHNNTERSGHIYFEDGSNV
jgi:hypothetical protein